MRFGEGGIPFEAREYVFWRRDLEVYRVIVIPNWDPWFFLSTLSVPKVISVADVHSQFMITLNHVYQALCTVLSRRAKHSHPNACIPDAA
jgi:hypothetical protein